MTFFFRYIIIYLYYSRNTNRKEGKITKTTYIHHSGFLVETDRYYYLFDYEKGLLPELDTAKPIFVLSSHSHSDHYNPDIFQKLTNLGMLHIKAILSEDIEMTEKGTALQVSPKKSYTLGDHLTLTTFQSTDLGVAFLIEDHDERIYHAGDLNDWVWDEESDAYNKQMTVDYRKQIDLLSEILDHREIDTAFVVLDPRQEKDYDRGMCYFLEKIPVKHIYPMHYWDTPSIIDTFLNDHPEYTSILQRPE